jgi:DNA repair photolyase
VEAFAARGICTGVMLMPVLPWLTDSEENIRAVVTRAHECGAGHVVPGFGVTLRNRQREHYYQQLDRLFPGLRARYERAFGDRYHAPAQGTARLEAAFEALATRYGLQRAVAPYRPAEAATQMPLF